VTTLALCLGEALRLDHDRLDALRLGRVPSRPREVATPDSHLAQAGQTFSRRVAGHATPRPSGATRSRLQLLFLPQATLETILHHHERWDGTELLSRSGRCRHSADGPHLQRLRRLRRAYSDRPYKTAWSHDDARAEIWSQAGRQSTRWLSKRLRPVNSRRRP
jgi:hypothetical protein